MGKKAVIAVLVLLYVGALSPRWYISSDSASYLMLGSSLSGGEGYTICGQQHTKFPHGFPLFVAAMTSIGLGSVVWLNLAMLVMALATIAMIYLVVRIHGPPELALPVAIAVGLSYDMFLRSHALLTEVPFMLLVFTGLWCYVSGLEGGGRGRLELGTLALIAACSIRVVGGPLVVAAAVGLLLERSSVSRGRLWANSLLLILGTATVGLFFYLQFHQADSSVVTPSYAAEVSQLTTRPIYSWLWMPFQNLFETGPELVKVFSGQEAPAAIALFLFWLPAFWGAYGSFRDRKFVCLLATAGYLGAILLLRPAFSRYLLPVAPFLWLYFIQGIRGLTERRSVRTIAGQPVWAVVVILLVLLNLPKDLRLAYAVHREDFVSFRDDWPPLVEVADLLRSRVGEDEKFVSGSRPIVLAYLSGRPCLQIDRNQLTAPPGQDEILANLKSAGVRHIVIDREPKHAYHRELELAIGTSDDLQLIFENDDFKVYSSDPTPDAVNGNG
jgi:hypothetical protein